MKENNIQLDERIIYSISVEQVQSAAEANLGRRLDEKELKRLLCVFISNEEFFDAIYGAIVDAAEEAMEGQDWCNYDKENEKYSLEQLK